MEHFNNLIQKKNSLEQQQQQLFIQLNSIKKQLTDCNNSIYDMCIKNGGHQFRKERDYKLNGETTFICQKCNFIK